MKKKIDAIDTITLDSDTDFSGYKNLENKLKAKIYFCDPYKSWQKGAVENGNRLLREYVPKRFNINLIKQKEIDKILDTLNSRPMKILAFMTPKKAYLKETQNRVSI